MRSSLFVLAVAVAAAPAARADQPSPRVVATKGLMLDLAHGRLHLRDLIDRDAGLVFVDHFAGPGDDPEPRIVGLQCGAALDRQVERVEGWIRSSVPSNYDEGQLTCRNRPSPQCDFGGSMEWDPVVHLHFRVDPDRGLVLRAVTIDDEVLVGDAAVARELRAQGRLITRLSAKRCTPV